MNSLKVIQILPNLNEGGVEKGTLELGDYLVKQGNISIVISGEGRMIERLKQKGSVHYNYKYIGEKSPRALFYIYLIRRILLKERPDILHLRSRLPAWIAYLAYKSIPLKMRPKLVTTFHGFYSVNKYSAIMTKGDKIIAVSNVISEHIKEAYAIADDKIVVIHRGVGDEYLNSDNIYDVRIKALKEKWGLSDKTSPIILLPARLTKLKGHDLLIESLYPLRDIGWTTVFVGDFDDKSSYANELKNMVSKYHLTNRIIFAGHCSDMPAAIKLSDIVISASTRPESFGRTVVEAQAMGKPVIASNHGGSLETVKDGQTGWLFKHRDRSDLTNILHKAILDKNLRESLGKNGQKWVKENFTTEKMCEKTVKLYKDLLNRKKGFEKR